jgi:uncharacterized protein YqjF (DUF2071 family)
VADRPASPFLRAEWRHVAVLNYGIDPAHLARLVPAGTELDLWQGRAYVSLVGFLFLDTTVRGLSIPFHRNFEEVNLRFYVRRHAPDGWRRAVVFVREIVPRSAIALTARALYNENYVARPMGHCLEWAAEGRRRLFSVAYHWRHEGRDLGLRLTVGGDMALPAPGSEEEFVIEHYWGYAAQRDGGTVEYRVEHPPWRVAPAARAQVLGDVGRFYGAPFEEAIRAAPLSSFVAEGSPIVVYAGRRIS